MPVAIELDGVSFAYPGGPDVLQDVSLRVAPGEFVAIAGPNGGGKTTLMRLILGLERPRAGTVRLGAADAVHYRPRRAIAYLAQRARLGIEAPITVREIVTAGRAPVIGLLGRLGDHDHALVAAAIERVGLSEEARTPLQKLSGGQQQRALIAKALAAEPELLVLDEPTTGVDVDAQDAFAELLAELNGETNATILYVSHEFGSVERLVDRLVLVRRSIVFDVRRPRFLPRGTTRRTRMLELQFMQLAFAVGMIVGLLAPAVGFFLVQRRLSLIGDGIGHVAFAGVAAGYLLGLSPVATALVASVAGAVAIEWLRTMRRTAGDQALALIFYTGIAAGVVLISAAGALNANLFTYLFGSILTVTGGDLRLVAILGALGLGLIALLFRSLVAVALDEEGARVSGVPVPALNIALAVLAGVTIAISMRVVGILLIAALMVLPVIAADRIAWSVTSTMFISMAIGVTAVVIGLTTSYYYNLAPGGTIVLAAAGFFLVTSTVRAWRKA